MPGLIGVLLGLLILVLIYLILPPAEWKALLQRLARLRGPTLVQGDLTEDDEPVEQANPAPPDDLPPRHTFPQRPDRPEPETGRSWGDGEPSDSPQINSWQQRRGRPVMRAIL